jgi:hypothetical protein
VANFAMCYGHYGEFGCALWATTADFVIQYTKGHYGGFGYALWASAQNAVVQ